MSRFPRNDKEWREYIIETVKPYSNGKGYELSFDSSYCIGCPDNSVEPKVGDTLRIYGPLFGTVRGMFIDGFKVYYRTEKMRFFSAFWIVWSAFWAMNCFSSILNKSEPSIVYLLCFAINIFVFIFWTARFFSDE